MVSVVVRAHDEARVIGRLLSGLVEPATPDDLDVIVVANGCTDDTAEIAASFGPPVRVVATPVPSKTIALRLGDRSARDFPRLYVDADVELGADDVHALCAALARPGVLAAGPDRVVAASGSSWPVRAYYEVWSRLPEVRRGLFGRGVIAMTKAGHRRVLRLPPVIGDDLATSLAFSAKERVVVPEARVVVHPPRTWGGLLRRRVRAAMSVTQLQGTGQASVARARTTWRDLGRIVREEPRLVPALMVFLCTALVARVRLRRTVRRGDYSSWLRDDSHRRRQNTPASPHPDLRGRAES